MADCACTNFPANLGNVTIGANLGIGVVSVPSPLTLVKAASGAYAAVLQNDSTDSAAKGLFVAVNQNSSTNILLDVVAGSDPRLRVLGDGRVGIGVASPASSLHVQRSQLTGYSVQLYNPSTDTAAHGLLVRVDQNTASNVLLDVLANADSRLRVLGDGTVGIGTSAPGAPLEVAAAADAQLRLTDARAAAANIGPGLELYATNGGGVIGKLTTEKQDGSPSSSSFSLAFWTKQDGVPIAERMRLQYDGTVGIGTADPEALLQVQGGSQDALQHVLIVGGKTSSGDAKALLVGVTAGTPEILLTTGGAGASARLALSSGGAGAQVVVLPSGNVGIGTTTPATRLHVHGAQQDAYQHVAAVSAANAAGDTKSLYVGIDAGTPEVRLTTGGAGPDARLALSTGGQAGQVTLLPSGHVGIGTASPAARLQVQGPAQDTLQHVLVLGVASTAGQNKALLAGIDPSAPEVLLTTGGAGTNPRLGLSAGGAAAQLVILPGGQVGIGTTAPQTALQVQGAQQDSHQNLLAVAAANAAGQPKSFLVGIQAGTPEVLLTTGGAGTTARLGLSAGGAGAQMVLLADGHVGIGLTGPQAPLHVEKATPSGYATRISNPSAEATANGLYVGVNKNVAGNVLLEVAGAGASRLRVLGDGTVGIGTEAPLAKLHVEDGEIMATGDPGLQHGRMSARQFYGLNASGQGKKVADFDGCYYA